MVELKVFVCGFLGRDHSFHLMVELKGMKGEKAVRMLTFHLMVELKAFDR